MVKQLPMRYAIITNPASGRMTVEQKRSALKGAAAILDAQVHGLDIPAREVLIQRTRQLAEDYDVIVIAGGDGTFSDVINAIDPSKKPVAFLPLGSGNAMRYALGYKGNLLAIADRIKRGRIREFDLIDCDGKRRAVTAGVGIEGTILRLRDRFLAQGITGFRAYLHAMFAAYFRFYKCTHAEVTIDGLTFSVPNLLTLMITKQPYYGYGMNIIPRARLADGRLHVFWADRSLLQTLYGLPAAFTIGNRSGHYKSGQKVELRLQSPLSLHIDGNRTWEADRFSFTILPKALKIKC
jgi:diacylglycerol kinase (ATP)